MFDGKKYENMLSHDYRKYLINGGNIKLSHLKEDKIFLKIYNRIKPLNSYEVNKTNLHGVKPLTSFDLQRINPLNEIAPEKISVTPTKLSTASVAKTGTVFKSLIVNEPLCIC